MVRVAREKCHRGGRRGRVPDAAAEDGCAIHFRSKSEFQLLSEPQILKMQESRLLNLNLRC